jgi:hypothetical protein
MHPWPEEDGWGGLDQLQQRHPSYPYPRERPSCLRRWSVCVDGVRRRFQQSPYTALYSVVYSVEGKAAVSVAANGQKTDPVGPCWKPPRPRCCLRPTVAAACCFDFGSGEDLVCKATVEVRGRERGRRKGSEHRRRVFSTPGYGVHCPHEQ